MLLKNFRNHFPYTPSAEAREQWERESSQFEVTEKLGINLQPGDIFRVKQREPFTHWHRFIEIIPQDVLPDFLLIHSTLLPDGIKGFAYFPAHSLFEVKA